MEGAGFAVAVAPLCNQPCPCCSWRDQGDGGRHSVLGQIGVGGLPTHTSINWATKKGLRLGVNLCVGGRIAAKTCLLTAEQGV